MTLDQSFVLAVEEAFPQALTASFPISGESNSRVWSTIAAARRRLGKRKEWSLGVLSWRKLGGSSSRAGLFRRVLAIPSLVFMHPTRLPSQAFFHLRAPSNVSLEICC